MPANYIDNVLAHLNGRVACIWISGFVFLEGRLDEADARTAFRRLHEHCPQLCVRYDTSSKAWVRAPFSDQGFTYRERAESQERLVAALIDERIDLAKDAPFRLGFATLPERGSLLFLQLHHALGDGRSFTLLLQQYLELLSKGRATTFTPVRFDSADRAFVSAVLARPKSLATVLRPSARLSAKRGLRLKSRALEASSLELGAPRHGLRVFELPRERSSASAAGPLYLASLAYACAARTEGRGAIRLRIPVDVRAHMKLGRAFGNFCPCVSLELDRGEVLSAAPEALARDVERQLTRSYEERAYLAGHLEGLAYDRVLSRFSGEYHDYASELRSNTMVATYMGDMGRVLRASPFRVRTIAAHTPTWGSIGLKHENQLVFNLNYYAGLWDGDELDAFFGHVESFLARCGVERRQRDLGDHGAPAAEGPPSRGFEPLISTASGLGP